MYKEKFVATVKVGGRILRENTPLRYIPRDHGSIVQLPFGSEYSILLKNLNTRKAKVRVTIDGEDVLDGHSLLLDPKETMELNGFMKGDVVKNMFRFIEKTNKISEYRGDRIDDGIIDITFSFEEPSFTAKVIQRIDYNSYWRNKDIIGYPICDSDCKGKDGIATYQIANCVLNSAPINTYSANNDDQSNDVGITVKGSQINDKFVSGYIGNTGESYNIVLRLVGRDSKDQIIKTPLTTRTKIVCDTCGVKNKTSNKFCGECGTCLCD